MPVYLDDKKLAKRLLAGEQQAFDQFFDENFARLYRFSIVRLGHDADAAKEIVQAVLFKALRKMDTYRAESALFTWICVICRHEISDWLRRERRYRDHVVLVEDIPEVAGAIDSWVAPPEEGPEHQYAREEAVGLIQLALDRLPAKYGNVLEWKYVEGHSVREIATRLDLGTEATQSLLARAKRAFADVYGTLRQAVADNNGRLTES